MNCIIKFRTLTVALLLAIGFVLCAQAQETSVTSINSEQYNKWKDSKPFVEGLKALEEEESRTAFDSFTQELKLHPKNGYAMCNLALSSSMKLGDELYELFLSGEIDMDNIDEAISEAGKKVREDARQLEKGISMLPPEDKASQCAAYRALADMLTRWCEDDTVWIMQAYNNAVMCHPCKDSYFARMSYISEQHEDFVQYIEDDAKAAYALAPDDAAVVKVMALIAKENGDVPGFMRYYDQYQALVKSQSLEPDFDLDMVCAQMYGDMGMTEDAIDMYLNAISYSEKTVALEKLVTLLKDDDQAATIALMKINQMQFADEGDGNVWSIVKGIILKDCMKDYDGALALYSGLLEDNHGNSYITKKVGECLLMLGDVARGKQYIQAASMIDGSSDYRMLLCNLGELTPVLDYYKSCNATADFYKYGSGFYASQAELHLLNRAPSQALEVLDLGFSKDNESALMDYYYGIGLKNLGRSEEAIPYFEKALALSEDEEEGDYYVTIVSNLELGNIQKAQAELDTLKQLWDAEQKERVPGVTQDEIIKPYDLACLYSLMGDSTTALEVLKTHFEQSDIAYNFGMIEKDWRLDPVRSLPEFQQLINTYYSQWKNNNP